MSQNVSYRESDTSIYKGYLNILENDLSDSFFWGAMIHFTLKRDPCAEIQISRYIYLPSFGKLSLI